MGFNGGTLFGCTTTDTVGTTTYTCTPTARQTTSMWPKSPQPESAVLTQRQGQETDEFVVHLLR